MNNFIKKQSNKKSPTRLISLRMPIDIDIELKETAKKLHKNKTDIIIEQLSFFLKQRQTQKVFQAAKGLWKNRKDPASTVENLYKRRSNSRRKF